MSQLRVTARIVIGEEELEERFIQASGPGGQNVNKVATAVQLRFDVGATRAFDEEVKRRLKTLAGRRLGKDGVLTIEAKRYRSQERNRADARQRLIELVRRAAAPGAATQSHPSDTGQQAAPAGDEEGPLGDQEGEGSARRRLTAPRGRGR